MLVLFAITLAVAHVAPAAAYPYLSPLPGSTLVPTGTTIVLRDGRAIEPASVQAGRVVVAGTMSGRHAGRLALARDGRTLVFTPDRPFAAMERVAVAIGAGLRTTDGAVLAPQTFEFTTSPGPRTPRLAAGGLPEDELLDAPSASDTPSRAASRASSTPIAPSTVPDYLPLQYQPITITTSNAPDPGVIFVSPWTGGAAPIGRLQIVDNDGQPLFYRKMSGQAYDWKRQPSGLLTYISGLKYYALDSSYAVVDSFAMGNGYSTDIHDMQLLPDGHALLMSYDYEPYAMDTVVAGGKANATVIGAILQELDADKNVVFQWRSWDHFLITDADTCLVNLRGSTIDYVHVNAVEFDHDGNLLMSSRHMNEITKIERGTGSIMWRMGPRARRNQFEFIPLLGSPRGWTAQHDIRRLPNGDITLFDNGNCVAPNYSRALEYSLDEENLVATEVWEFRNAPDSYGGFMGNVQRLPTGSSMICWGGTGPDPKMTEVHEDGTVALQLGWQNAGMWSYRGFKFPWSTSLFTLDQDAIDFGQQDTPVLHPVTVTSGVDRPVTLTGTYCPHPAFTCNTAFPIVLPPHGSVTLDIRYAPTAGDAASATLYVRTQSDTLLVAQPIKVSGLGGLPRVSVTGTLQPEGNWGASTMWFKLTPSFRPLEDIVVHYQTADGSATVADHDYFPISGTMTIPAGTDSSVIPVSVFGDTKVEQDEGFALDITVENATLANPEGTATIINDDGVLAVDDAAPLEFALHAPQPTPFRDATTLRYDLPRAGRVTLEVFDVRGRRVATLVDGARPAGRHRAAWNAAGQVSGMYFARLTTDGATRTQRLVLAR